MVVSLYDQRFARASYAIHHRVEPGVMVAGGGIDDRIGIPLVVDQRGTPLHLILSGANKYDSLMLAARLDAILLARDLV